MEHAHRSRQSASAPALAEDYAAEQRFPRPVRPALSFEVMPPRTRQARQVLPELIDIIESYGPDYVAITSSAKSGWAQGTADFVRELSATTRLRPLAHLACTAAPTVELLEWVERFIDAGVRGFLAVRGDLAPGQASPPAGHLPHADALVARVRQLERRSAARFCGGGLSLGVAAYPSGHPESSGPDEDLDVLAAKQRAGADFAITQLFFDTSAYSRLVRAARLAGVTMPIIPGILPITSSARLERMAHLSGLVPPQWLGEQLEDARCPEHARDIGLIATVELAQRVLDAGAPGLHFYTFNDPRTTVEVLDRLGIDAMAASAVGHEAV